LRDLSGQTALGAAFDGLQQIARYVEEALADLAQADDRKLANEMLGRAAAQHISVMAALLAAGAEPSLIDTDGNTLDANTVVATHRALAGESAAASDGAKDEL